MNKKIMFLSIIVIGLLVVGSFAIAEMMKVEQYNLSVNPYTEVTQELRNVQAIEISNNGIAVRMAFNDVSTADTGNYWLIPDTAVGYERDGLMLQYCTLRLLGDDAANGDTAVVRVLVYKE